MTTTSAEPDTMKDCEVCHNKIPRQAKYCTHCRSYQDWRRNFPASAAVIATAAAAVSILATAWPTISDFFHAPQSDLHALIVTSGAGDVGVSVFAWNTGRQPGVVTKATVDYLEADGTKRTFKFQPNDSSGLVIESGQAKSLQMHIGGKEVGDLKPGEFDPANGKCVATIDTVSSRGEIAQLESAPDCHLLLAAISNTGGNGVIKP